MNPLTNFKPLVYLITLFAVMILTACAPNQEQITAQTATAQTAIAASWTPTFTSTATPTSTVTQTVTPSPTATQTLTQTPTETPTTITLPGTDFTIKDVTFSLFMPEDWEKADSPDGPVMIGPTVASKQLSVGFLVDQYNLFGSPMDADEVGIPMFAAQVQDNVTAVTKDFKQVSEDFLETEEGKMIFRWEIEHKTNGKELHQVFYISGSGKWYLIAIYTRPISAGSEYDPIIDETMKKLLFEK